MTEPSSSSIGSLNITTVRNRIELCSTILRELLGLYENIHQRKRSTTQSVEEENAMIKKEMSSYQRAAKNINVVIRELESVEHSLIKSSMQNGEDNRHIVKKELEYIHSRTNYKTILERAKRFGARIASVIGRKECDDVILMKCGCGVVCTTESERDEIIERKIKELSELCDLMSRGRAARLEAEKDLAGNPVDNSKVNKENITDKYSDYPIFYVPPTPAGADLCYPPISTAAIIQRLTEEKRRADPRRATAIKTTPFFYKSNNDALLNKPPPRITNPQNDQTNPAVNEDDGNKRVANTTTAMPAKETPNIKVPTVNADSKPVTDSKSAKPASRNRNPKSEGFKFNIVVQAEKSIPKNKKTDTVSGSKEPAAIKTITNLPRATARKTVINNKFTRNDAGPSNPFGKFRINRLPVRLSLENENQKKVPERPKEDPNKKVPVANEPRRFPSSVSTIKSHKCRYEPEDYIAIDGRYKIVPHLERKRYGAYGVLPLPYMQFLPWVPIAPPTCFDDVSPFRKPTGLAAKSYSQVFHRPPL